jgi:hypothetical protein
MSSGFAQINNTIQQSLEQTYNNTYEIHLKLHLGNKRVCDPGHRMRLGNANPLPPLHDVFRAQQETIPTGVNFL